MRKILFLFLLMTTPLFSAFIPEVRVSYFQFNESILREIYSSTVNTQLGLNYGLCNCLYGFGSVGYFSKEGSSLGEEDRTEITVVPLNLGLKFFLPFKTLEGNLFIEAGGTFYHVSIHNDSDFVLRKVYRNGVGGFVGVGALWRLWKSFYIDIFSDYSYRQTSNLNHQEGTTAFKMNFGGLDIGGGLSYRF